MTTAQMYSSLRDYGLPVVETREAAARLGTSTSNATHRLRSLEKTGLVQQLCRGLWALEAEIDPAVVAPYLTAPYPAYVSLWSALFRHDMIEQIPRMTYAVSLDRRRVVETAVGTFSVHHICPELFTGFEGSPGQGFVATPEKALFDCVYLRAPAGGRVFFPELLLPPGFEEARPQQWIERIDSPRLKTLASRGLERALAQARQPGAR